MGWASCGEDSQGRPIGYAFEATCDHPGCNAKIDRGLAYACGGMHGDGGHRGYFGCEKYFCQSHMRSGEEDQLCFECWEEEQKYLAEEVGSES